MSYFIFDNKRIYYDEIGTGTTLLFLHGNTASSKMFYDIAEKYKKNFKVILFDFLGHGKSDRLEEFPADLWFYEAEQITAFLREKNYSKIDIIGCSGGALVAINVALEAPELVNKVIADSFMGERPLKLFTENVKNDRELSKNDEGVRMFYTYMHGSDWEQIVDNDTNAIVQHSKNIGVYFHKNLQFLIPDILLTGSKKDEFVFMVSPDYYEEVYGAMIKKTGHGKIHLFDEGGHPAMLTNPTEFFELSMKFFEREN